MVDNENVLLTEDRGQVRVLTLNRPEMMNALNFDLLRALKSEIEGLRFTREIRVVVITGAGEKAFSAGADLKERATLSDIQVKEFIYTIRDLLTDLESLNKPVISAVNGVALGGGTEIALASDLRVASMNASMGLTETRLAIIPGGGGTQRLPRLVGRGKAKELIFTGSRVTGQQAYDIGLVNQVCEPQLLMDEAMKLAETICEAGPIAIEQAKYAIDAGMETDLRTGLAIESNAYWITIPTEDRLEGLAAFREKRKPVYKGK